jgi:hypothetical protein
MADWDMIEESIDAYVMGDLDALEEGYGNPYRNKMGRFSSASKAASIIKGNDKVMFKRRKNKSGKMVKRQMATVQPCGREARETGGNIRCHDGKVIRPVRVDDEGRPTRKDGTPVRGGNLKLGPKSAARSGKSKSDRSRRAARRRRR